MSSPAKPGGWPSGGASGGGKADVLGMCWWSLCDAREGPGPVERLEVVRAWEHCVAADGGEGGGVRARVG
ncbi:MAG: hypothetical protein JO122_01695 [Acetobacteraceae bacterium]|nr:hypothetical protein [Acetobacteraceae bacterium]